MEGHFFVLWLMFSSLKGLAEPAVPKNGIEIYSLHVDCKVTSRFAHTVITSKVVNRAEESQEALFEVELPKTAFITNFSMTIDGKTYPGIIKEKESAQVQYDDAVSRGQSAGLVKSTGRKLEQFHVKVNVAAAAKVTFELVYEELLKRKLGKYELLIKVKPKQLVNHFQIDTHIFEPQGISFLETESTFMTNELNDALTKVQDETKAHITFKPTLSQQRKSPELEETLLDGDFLIRYDVKRSVTAGDIQIVNGYFVHYFAPNQLPSFPKNIIFVIDQSGSMGGKKIQQTREALQKILDDLTPEDHFNLVVFSGSISVWSLSMLKATEENVELAKQYVKTILANGVTDINGALLTAIKVLDKDTFAELLPEKSISMIMLLTDGQPTTGEENVDRIQENIKKANNGKYFLYCLGFGFDVSYAFLEKMALENGGVARRIYEDSDAALQLQGFYHEIATPILKEIEMKYPDNAALEITQNSFKLLFDGSEIVVAGKLGNDIDVLPVEIKAQAHSSDLTVKEDANVTEKEQVFQHQKYIFGDFIERLWAYLTIQQLLEKSVLAEGREQKDLETKALNLSLKFSFVTPLTSMVVTKPESEEVANKPTEADNENFRSSRIPSYGGIGGFVVAHWKQPIDPVIPGHRVIPGVPGPPGFPDSPLRKGYFGGSPFWDSGTPFRLRLVNRNNSGTIASVAANLSFPQIILQLPSENDTLCLIISGQPETRINLLSDPEKGIQVTGKLGKRRLFVQFEIAFQKPDIRINISKQEIVVNLNGNATMLPWTMSTTFTVVGLNIIVEVEEEKSLLLRVDNITMKISLVKFPKDFLGLYIVDSNFSEHVTGPLGQFFFNTHFEGGSQDKRRKKIIVQGQRYNTLRQNKTDYRTESLGDVISCWTLNLNP
ncbi:inter-alpha-trypsin inhibitor heavy chain H4-like isoform X2 [Sceloporus undulatus]|uniref:inter-alpha-trypsin inhibitor heavy chain H4-like isoform X2 n=1 Tax=Sceloporus undulatus TaxID=8520 RepID=UPI001C4DD3BA|nr:inter-alpha-trypsin inhibitor heavy chain H4-like isoform X2 [Sceloporus undulatus]